jgi:outer membrane murein-binding lipoprotein Lpp
MSLNANVFATWAAIVSVTVAGGVWVGAIGNEVSNQKEQHAKLERLPSDVAVLSSQVTDLKATLAEIKAQQTEILRELRSKN